MDTQTHFDGTPSATRTSRLTANTARPTAARPVPEEGLRRLVGIVERAIALLRHHEVRRVVANVRTARPLHARGWRAGVPGQVVAGVEAIEEGHRAAREAERPVGVRISGGRGHIEGPGELRRLTTTIGLEEVAVELLGRAAEGSSFSASAPRTFTSLVEMVLPAAATRLLASFTSMRLSDNAVATAAFRVVMVMGAAAQDTAQSGSQTPVQKCRIDPSSKSFAVWSIVGVRRRMPS